MIEDLPIDVIKNFPLDYMHLVCLGVVKKLINIWMTGAGSYQTKLSGNEQNRISCRMLNIARLTPSEFARTSRSLKNFGQFKATEFRTFLLYTGPVVLKDILYEEAYKHFILLHVAITICSSDHFKQYLDIAEEILDIFVDMFGDLYGKEQMSYNVHSLKHLVNDVKCSGNLNNFSAFPFESKLGQIKRQIKSGYKPLQQIARRTTEQNRTIKIAMEQKLKGVHLKKKNQIIIRCLTAKIRI